MAGAWGGGVGIRGEEAGPTAVFLSDSRRRGRRPPSIYFRLFVPKFILSPPSSKNAPGCRRPATPPSLSLSLFFSPHENKKEYDAHLSKVRSFLARPNGGNAAQSSCDAALRDARACVHAMLGLAEIEGDPFKVEESRRKLARDVGPLEAEVRGRKRTAADCGGGTAGGGGRRGGGGDRGGRELLFGARRGCAAAGPSSSYAPPSIGNGGSVAAALDEESGEWESTMAPLAMDGGRMEESERLLYETRALCAESEQIGNATLETMGRQREQIERAGDLVGRSIENTRMARQIMKEM